MKDSFRQSILVLIKSALSGTKLDLPKDIDIENIVKYAKKNELGGMVYYGAVNCGVDTSVPAMQKLYMQTCRFILANENQLFEIDSVCKAFEENGIDYMPVKGTLLKHLYPQQDMRVMGDADILIKVDQYESIAKVMRGLGFTEKVESDHELAWCKPELFIELHKRLIPSYNKDYFNYYGDGWQLAHPCKDRPHRFEMTDEDQMIYLFTHFAKHYRDGGIGIRHMVDLYVYRCAKPDLDSAYIKKELEKLQLCEFYENVMYTISVWFEEAQENEISKVITDVIFGSGIYGTKEGHIVSDGVRKLKGTNSAASARRKRWISIIFLSYKKMCLIYSFLKKAPFLLPIMWVVRWISVLFFKGENIKKQQKQMATLTTEKIESYQQTLNFVGLDFNFKE